MPRIAARDEIRSWMFGTALPLWARAGVDRQNGGYIEQLTLEGRDADIPFKRARVTGRQIYVFSHAAMLGWPEGNALAAHGVSFLTEKTWLGPTKGFARTLTRTGEALDSTPDLYDAAFALFALAWRHRAVKDAQSRDWMFKTLDYVETHLRHPSGVGFWHELPPKGSRQQNPHMHLTEACLVAYAATGEERFGATARTLVELYATRFFDKKTGTLHEYFADDWSPAPGDEGRIVEPGHMMEWAWILNEARKLLGVDTADIIRTSIKFAETYGVDPKTAVTFNTVRDDGQPIDRGSRTWPNTERIKAAVALYELDGVDPAPVIDASSRLLLDRYLKTDMPGLWIDAFDAEGRPLNKTVPASTLYHVFLAFAEVLRIAD